MSNAKLDKKVTVLVAISNASYFEKIDTYLKCLDYVEFFHKKENVNFTNFVSEIFDTDINDEREILIEFLGIIYGKYSDMNMRKIKLILRQANLNYIELTKMKYNPNRLICVASVASRYIKNGEELYFDQFRKNKLIPSGNEICRMICITNNKFMQYSNEYILDHEKKIAHTASLKLVRRPTPEDYRYPSIPYLTDNFHSDDGKQHTNLPDFYFMDL